MENLLREINFEKVIPVLDMDRFRRIYQSFLYQPPFDNLQSNHKSRKDFITYCLNEDEKEFVGLLLHAGQYAAANMIDPRTIDITDPTKLDPNRGRITTICPYIEHDLNLDIILKDDKKNFISNEYPMSKSPRGICLIINNYLTYGTFKEAQRFRNIFYQLHYYVIMEINLTAIQIMQKLTSLSKDPVMANHEAFACLIISHGTNKAEIIGYDNETIEIVEICQLFDDINCPNLARKPRMFVFNCCRGSKDFKKDYFAYLAPNKPKPSTQLAIPFRPDLSKMPMIDFLICFSTQDGFSADVDWDIGTKFGTFLCDTIVAKGYIRDLNQILIRTHNLLQNEQPFDWKQSFTQVLSFYPSIPFVKELPKF